VSFVRIALTRTERPGYRAAPDGDATTETERGVGCGVAPNEVDTPTRQ
jgi:hypothetical protein